MKKRKILAMLLAASLLLATLAGISAAGTETGGSSDTASTGTTESPEVPAVTIRGVQVDESYLELGLEVSAKQFQTVGVVLSYDDTTLQPVTWTEDKETGPALIPVEGDSWTAPTVIHTKGPDGLSGKPALAYAGYTTDDAGEKKPTGRSYLYLGADALAYENLSEQRVVTVRFRYMEGKTRDSVSMPGFPSADGSSPAADGPCTIELVSKDAAKDAIPGYPLLVTTGGGPDGSVRSFVYGEDYHDLQTDVTSFAPTFQLGEGDSVNTGGGSGDYAITFFDWDGRVIDAIAAEQNAASAVRQLEKQIQDKLSNKPGYAFDTWILVKQTEDGLVSEHKNLTSRKALSSQQPSDKVSFSATDPVSFADLSRLVADPSVSVLVQATYKTIEESDEDKGIYGVNNGLGENAALNIDESRYTFDPLTYYQYGNSLDDVNGQYAVRGTVRRNSVLRTDSPTVMVQVFVGAGNDMKYVTVKVDLENTDVANFEVVVPKTTTSVSYQLLDTYGITAWTENGVPRSAAKSTVGTDIVKGGAFSLILDEAVKGWQYVNEQCFRDAGYSKVTSAAQLTSAKNAVAGAVVNGQLSEQDAKNALQGFK